MNAKIHRADPSREFSAHENCFILELANDSGDPDVSMAAARTFDPQATVDDAALSVRIQERETPELIAALVARGARILEVRQETPALEDVYLQLMDGR